MNSERFVIDTNIFILRINDRLAEFEQYIRFEVEQ